MITRMQLRSSSSRTFTCKPSAQKYPYRLWLRSRRVHSSYTCSRAAFSRTTLFALSPGAPSPRIACNAFEKSPVDTPFRYSAGIRLSTLGTRFR